MLDHACKRCLWKDWRVLDGNWNMGGKVALRLTAFPGLLDVRVYVVLKVVSISLFFVFWTHRLKAGKGSRIEMSRRTFQFFCEKTPIKSAEVT